MLVRDFEPNIEIDGQNLNLGTIAIVIEQDSRIPPAYFAPSNFVKDAAQNDKSVQFGNKASSNL